MDKIMVIPIIKNMLSMNQTTMTACILSLEQNMATLATFQMAVLGSISFLFGTNTTASL